MPTKPIRVTVQQGEVIASASLVRKLGTQALAALRRRTLPPTREA